MATILISQKQIQIVTAVSPHLRLIKPDLTYHTHFVEDAVLHVKHVPKHLNFALHAKEIEL